MFSNQTHVPPDDYSSDEAETSCYISSIASISALLVSIISYRMPLWLSDLSCTQILQENVEEEHRGTIGGVQNGLNSLMDTLKVVKFT